MLKKIFLLFIVFIGFICCGCGKKSEPSLTTYEKIIERGSLIVGVKTDTYPFGYIDKNGKNAGYDIELAKKISHAIFNDDRSVRFVGVSPADRMMKLYTDDIDMIIATMSVTPKRKQILDFSIPYYVAGQALLVNNGSSIKGIRDLSGKKAIIVFGSTGEHSLRNAVPNVGIIGYKTYDEAYKALKQRKADAIVSDDTILIGLSLKDSSVKLLPKRYSKEPYAVAMKKGNDSKQLVKIVNQVIRIESKNGNLKKLQKDFGITSR